MSSTQHPTGPSPGGVPARSPSSAGTEAENQAASGGAGTHSPCSPPKCGSPRSVGGPRQPTKRNANPGCCRKVMLGCICFSSGTIPLCCPPGQREFGLPAAPWASPGWMGGTASCPLPLYVCPCARPAAGHTHVHTDPFPTPVTQLSIVSHTHLPPYNVPPPNTQRGDPICSAMGSIKGLRARYPPGCHRHLGTWRPCFLFPSPLLLLSPLPSSPCPGAQKGPCSRWVPITWSRIPVGLEAWKERGVPRGLGKQLESASSFFKFFFKFFL